MRSLTTREKYVALQQKKRKAELKGVKFNSSKGGSTRFKRILQSNYSILKSLKPEVGTTDLKD